jgi:hypothetical protein
MKGMEGRRLESVMIDLGERESGSERGERGGEGERRKGKERQRWRGYINEEAEQSRM